MGKTSDVKEIGNWNNWCNDNGADTDVATGYLFVNNML